MILVDTSVWSLAFRRKKSPVNEATAVRALRALIDNDADVRMPAIVLQEILSGVKHPEQFARLRRVLRGFPVARSSVDDHVSAAQIFNRCQSDGIAGTTVDCLIAAQCIGLHASLLTTDRDYRYICARSDLKLYPL